MMRIVTGFHDSIKNVAPLAIGAGTAGTGMAIEGTNIIQFAEWIPLNIGQWAALIGIFATIISTYLLYRTKIAQLRSIKLADEKTELEILKIQREMKDYSDFTIGE